MYELLWASSDSYTHTHTRTQRRAERTEHPPALHGTLNYSCADSPPALSVCLRKRLTDMDEPPPFAALTCHGHVPLSDANEEESTSGLCWGLVCVCARAFLPIQAIIYLCLPQCKNLTTEKKKTLSWGQEPLSYANGALVSEYKRLLICPTVNYLITATEKDMKLQECRSLRSHQSVRRCLN